MPPTTPRVAVVVVSTMGVVVVVVKIEDAVVDPVNEGVVEKAEPTEEATKNTDQKKIKRGLANYF